MDKRELYKKAKEAYYNGEPIMSDQEFDSLEKEIGLENKGYVGTIHSDVYTVKHPYMMGSLKKVQVHEKDGVVDWDSIYKDVCSYVDNKPVIITPKYDGCSFEIYWDNGVVTVSGRGDGMYGKDISSQILTPTIEKYINLVCSFFEENFKEEVYEFTVRGEVLVSREVFEKKYKNEFTNPRSFVAGCLGRDIKTNSDKKMCDDLSLKVYDIRYKDEWSGDWIDLDWDWCIINGYESLYPPTDKSLYKRGGIFSKEEFELLYREMDLYRRDCDFALDGFVIKPISTCRKSNFTKERPDDCVAVKFIPSSQDTDVIDIDWKLGKSGEWIPTIIVEPIVMDGKKVSRASAHNYGYLIDNKISIGTKVQLSLAGDIIPFIYKVTDPSGFDINNIGKHGDWKIDGCHAIVVEMRDEEKRISQFKHSALTLNIPGLGESQVDKLIEYLKEECKGDNFFGEEAKEFPTHILGINAIDIEIGIGGKNGQKIAKSYINIKNNASLADIIASFNFPSCGEKCSLQVANMWLGKDYSFSGISHEGYKWVTEDTNKKRSVIEVLEKIGRPIESFKEVNGGIELTTQIPIIMTGDPVNYKSKGEFLALHPEYRQTGSWKEVQIVFTNSLDSTTGKMKKAKEKGIKIELY